MNEILPIVLLTLGIIKNSFKKGRFTCNNFLLNIYLYIFITFLLMAFSVKEMAKHNLPLFALSKSGFLNFLVFFIIYIGVLIFLQYISPKYLIGKHLVWMLWILIMSYTLYPLYIINPVLFEMIKMQTFIILCLFTALTFWKPQLISLSWGTTLLTILLGLIIIRFVMLFFPKQKKMNYILSYFSIILFSIFLLYDTKILIKKAKECVQADYINDSLGVVLDGLNIFSNLFHVQD